ncbi:putative pentatricopeptide repeat-containing protein At3g25970 [Tasmannia lanceolata]|uniref:putative pentatricopeptide repeat-containing protein At3g25970 n=1 Tax=Tasmannia lanceolata TaxID=3420 RepID=UPI004063B3BE
MDMPLSSSCSGLWPIATTFKRPTKLSCSSCSQLLPIVSFSQFPTNLSTQPKFFQSSPTNHSITTQNNILLSSYSKSNTLAQTLKLFNLLLHRDTVTWNTILSACLRRGRFSTALRLFLDMLLFSSSHQSPDTLTFQAVLKSSAELNYLQLTLQLHSYMIKLYGLCSMDLILNTQLIGIYSAFHLIKFARQLFDRIPLRDVVAFAAMMAGYNEVGEYEDSLRIFKSMVESDQVALNEFAFTCGLCASAGVTSLFVGKQIHAHVVKAAVQSDMFVGTSLVKMYMECDRMNCAGMAFSEIYMPNVTSWNALMAGNLSSEDVIELFSRMRLSGVSPDHVTFATVLRACKCVALYVVQQIHCLFLKTMEDEMDVFVGGALFDRYVDQGCVHDATRVFQEMHGKDITAFDLAIQGYIRNGHGENAVGVFYEAIQIGMKVNEATMTSLMVRINGLNHGKQLHALVIKFGFCGSGGSVSIASSLVAMYSEYYCFDDAIRLFDQIQCPDLILWTSLISGFSQNGESQEALKLYVLMVSEGLVEPPNHYTFSSLMHSCANLAAVEEGKQIHAQIIKSNSNLESDPFVASGLIDMYAKCGCITEARKLFDKMPKQDLASWNAMITGLAQHGFSEKAIETFQELLNHSNVEPNHITYLCVLSACRHGGLVEEGYQYFRLIRKPSIDHYACLIDLVGHLGRLEEARMLIKEMPFTPNEPIWSSLLVASRIHGNIEMGEYSAKNLLQLNPKDPGTYVELSNIYASVGRWADANKIRKLMKDRGIRKKPGLSWLSVNGRTHVFFADKRS